MSEGTTRVVFIVGDYVIKFPRLCKWRTFIYGLISNITEREFVARNNGVDCSALARVICSCPLGFWLVMERADRVCSSMDEFKNDKDIQWFIAYWNSTRTDTFDDIPANIGYFGDKLKIIDYGG